MINNYQIGDLVKSMRNFRTIVDYDSDNHYGVVYDVGINKYGKNTISVQWFDGLVTTSYDSEIKPFTIRKKSNG